MFSIHLPESDGLPAVDVHLEHSLVSLSKWEAIHERAFFKPNTKMDETESQSYLHQMLLVPAPPNWIQRVPVETHKEIGEYINSKQSATWFQEVENNTPSREIVTAELIYYWMISFQIPFDPCQNWHLNRLMTLVKICGIKQEKPKPMSKQAQMEQYRRINEQRRRELGTSG